MKYLRWALAVLCLIGVSDWAYAANIGGGGGGASSGVSVTEDAAHSNGESIVPMGCRRKDTSATSAGADGDWATVDCTANGGLAVEVINGSATVTEDGDIPASTASVAQTASVGYCGTVAHGSNPTAVAAAGRAGNKCNRAGIPFVIGGHPNIVRNTFTVAAADGTRTDISLTGTINTGTKVVVTEFQAKVSPNNSVAVTFRAGCGGTNTPSASLTGATLITDATYSPSSVPGERFGDGAGIVLVCADGEEVRYTSSAPTGGHLYITLSYYTIES